MVMAGADRSSGSVHIHPATLPIICPSAWQGKAPPERLWLIDQWIPACRATLLTGDGGSGKSLLAQQLATCVALGVPFMGVEARRQRALYLTCEDDMGELQRRQSAICRAMGIEYSQLDEELFLSSRVGEIDNSLLYFDATGGPVESPFLQSIRDICRRKSIFFIVLDNIAHLFDGNENIRHHVATFCNALERLAIEIAGTVLFIGHPSKAGAQFSGSTAWENQLRSRLFLERPAESEGDDDARVLRRSKSNYARIGDGIRLRWQDWTFQPITGDHDNWHEEMAQNSAAASDNLLFLELLRERDKQGLPVSARAQSRNFAPKELAKMPRARKVSAERFDRAMHRLLALGTIREAEEINPKDRHKYRRIIECGPVAGQSLGLFASPSQSAANPGDGVRGPDDCGPDCGPDIEASAGTTESRANPPENGAGQLPVILVNRGGGEAPPIGGLSPSPFPDAGSDAADPFA
jgi:RecA-family ATPase